MIGVKMRDQKKYQAWIICLTGAVFLFFQLFSMNMLNTVSKDLMLDLSLSSKGLGLLSSTYYYGNLVIIIPAGLLLDKFSTRKLLLGFFSARCDRSACFCHLTFGAT